MPRILLSVALAAAAGLGGATSVVAANFGSATIVTLRSCADADSTTICDGNGLTEQEIVPPSTITGGAGIWSSASYDNPGQGEASGSTSYATTPILTGEAISLGDYRVGNNDVAYYTYTNMTGAPVPITLAATVTFASSSVSPSDPNLPSGSVIYLDVSIDDPSVLTGSDPLSIFNDLVGAACGDSGVEAAGLTTVLGSGVGSSASVTSSVCGGSGAYDVAPGQSVLIADSMQMFGNRNGEIDPASLVYTEAPIPDPLEGVPEPAAWALMLAGFAIAGGALRRRARLAKLTA
ncbi:MAG: PEPxxWA-CTERM sorting domain-containing protein [Caulobacteraceae bacterium]